MVTLDTSDGILGATAPPGLMPEKSSIKARGWVDSRCFFVYSRKTVKPGITHRQNLMLVIGSLHCIRAA
ncbi:MAG: hypothetical protein AB4352_15215 [Hormoscilla sp.]